jgi:poly(hydroxyalkanoate) depolymerase family esterase
MTLDLPPDMQEATRLTRAGRLAEATALLQRLLGGGTTENAASPRTDAQLEPPQLDLVANEVQADALAKGTHSESPQGIEMPAPQASLDTSLPNLLRDLVGRFGRSDLVSSLQSRFSPASVPSAQTVPSGGTFLARSYSNLAGTRPYKLYLPSSYRADGPELPLIVMLHGCTQSPDDFAAGTRMNLVAEEQSCLVAYPGQIQAANPSKCWNWFNSSDQRRDEGEPSLIAGITRQVMRDYRVDPKRVYVAGLSAGGAAAAIMGSTYPDLYAAVGVHSGLACGAAHDLQSALHAMKQGGAPKARPSKSPRLIPTIVFHGDRDSTVNLRNGEQVLASAGAGTAADVEINTEKGTAPGGRAYSRTLHRDRAGKIIFEHWRVHGAGHAWFGGSPVGSYTDARGPNASREMVRFFLQVPPKHGAQAGLARPPRGV